MYFSTNKFIVILDEIDEIEDDFNLFFWRDIREDFGYVQLWGFLEDEFICFDVLKRDHARHMWE